MTDTVTAPVTDSAEKTSSLAVEIQVGRQLEAARKAQQLSVTEIAERLRLGEKQVRALETGDVSALPGKTFVRGFVRNYARAVHIDPAPLMNLLDGANELPAPKLELPESTHVAMPGQRRGVNRDLLTVVAGLALVAIAAALYFFLPEQWIESLGKQGSDSEQNAQPEANQPFLEDLEILSEESDGATAASDPEVLIPVDANANTAAPAPQTPATPANARPTPATDPAAAAPAVPTAANARVHLDFSDTSWVEIRDKTGKTLSSAQHPAGTQHEVAGAPPLTVIIGRASGVKLRYQGQPVTLRPSADSDIARVVLP
ncbi:hypothetical protein AGMMS50289_09660 [Betaproteobacteria bacterium]|nr:hypothetical protein AGMMS50289_09660 [Betaproteobacteria bacterium]